MDLGHYDIAHYLGHKAIYHLYLAYRIYTVPVSQALAENGISGFNIDFKENSDFEIEKARNSVRDISKENVDPINAFHFANSLSLLKQREAEHCIDASIYFQSMMEASINDALGKKAKGSFKDKWLKYLNENGAKQSDIDYFESYHDNIYKKIRIPSVHAKDRKGLINIEALRFSFVHENIKKGWFSFIFLLNNSHGFDMNYEDNWKIMSEEAHNVPATIDDADYPDYSLIVGELYKYHLDHFNSLS